MNQKIDNNISKKDIMNDGRRLSGILCPKCRDESRASYVVDSRGHLGGKHIRRRRNCMKCSYRFTTYETVGIVVGDINSLSTISKEKSFEMPRKIAEELVVALQKFIFSLDEHGNGKDVLYVRKQGNENNQIGDD